ncbi:hypothetical protein NQ314_005548 [Rhamnusium bicolor]|uniref:Uncharacterized protein n=1 Tax=Rhamnusium bicolor TaxID=1586634 RepID=A0AAV8ZGR4_9CUCU|nr:hypothetical protein NQ314_005548 [Rhamnusium bicolor]
MTTEFDEIVVDKGVSENTKNNEFYPFYVCRRNSRRKSSLQSLHHRRSCRLVKRLVRKSGKSSIHRNTANSQHLFRYLLDLSNTLIESNWKWLMLAVSLAFILTWLIFAGLWMIIAIDNEEVASKNSGPCLGGINGFAGYLLFSIETQSTIGYGTRYINGYCPEAVFLMCVQIILGVCICGSLICIVYLKMIRPHKLHAMNCFSKFSVICQRDGELCLIFRVRDSANKYECLTQMSAYLVQKRKGELFLKSIKLEPVGILIWPVEVVHRINEYSPFWDLSAKDLIIKRFEIIIVMDGTSLATSNTSRTTTSYLSREIKWGYRFKSCTTYDKVKRMYVVNHSLFNKLEEIDTPLCSSKRLRQVYSELVSLTTSEFSPNTSKYSSPLFSDMKTFQACKEEEEDQFSNSIVTTSAIVHAKEDEHNIDKTGQNIKSEMEEETDEDSSSGNELTFQDLSLDDLTKENVKSYSNLGGKTKKFDPDIAKFCFGR